MTKIARIHCGRKKKTNSMGHETNQEAYLSQMGKNFGP